MDPVDLLSIPVHVLKSEWLLFLSEHEIPRLDSACCSRQSRARFHEILSGEVVTNTHRIPLQKDSSRWIQTRLCHFRSLAITCRTRMEDLEGTLQHCTDALIEWDTPLDVGQEPLKRVCV
jgi:hypothetical protein